MLFQAPADIYAGTKARLQIAGVPFNKASSVSKADLRRAAEDPVYFAKLVRLLTPKRKAAT